MSQQCHIRGGGIFALVAAGALILSGCSSSGTEPEGDDARVEFSLSYQAANALESPYETLAEQYMKENPNVSITLNPQPNDTYVRTLNTQLQAGNASDLIQTAPGLGQGNSVVHLGGEGFLEPLSDESAKLIPAGSESLFGADGEVYGQPVDLTVTGIVFAQSSAESAGVAGFPADYDAMLETCATLAADGKSLIALAGSAPPNTGMTAMSISASRVYAAEPDWNERRAAGEVTFADSEGWQSTLETIVELHEEGCFQTGAEAGGFDAITNGLGQSLSFSAFVPSATAKELMQAVPDSVFSVNAFPVEAGGTPYILASANYALSINSSSEKKSEVQDYLEWLAQPKQSALFAETSGALPVTGAEGLDLAETIYAPVADLLEGEFAPLPNNMWPNSAVYDELGVGVQGLLTGQRTVQQVLAAMDAAWDQ